MEQTTLKDFNELNQVVKKLKAKSELYQVKHSDSTEWCERCKEVTAQIESIQHGENYDTECKICGHKNFHIQGFNYNLM